MGADLHREVGLLEGAGLSREGALAAATRVSASRAGAQADGLGCVAAGCVADLVLWSGDLAEGELSPSRIAQVWLGGAALLAPAGGGDIDPALEPAFKEKNRVFAPYGFYDPIAGVMLGASASHFDVLDSGVAVDLGLQASLRGRVSLGSGASIPSPIPRASLDARVGYDGLPTSWYGGGNDTRLGDQQTYIPDMVRGSVTTSTSRGARALAVRLSGEGVRTDLAALPGGGAGAARLTVGLDSRDSVTEPWRGGAVFLGGEAGLASRGTGFGTARAEARGYLTPVDWHTLAVRVVAEQASPGTPWWRLPELSSSSGLGRGYLPDRFVDQRLVAAQAEVRSRIWRGLGAAGFLDVGQVAPRWTDLQRDGFHLSPGFSLRVRINAQVTLSWDVGFGLEDDGPPSWTLLYRSGHPF